MDYREWSINPSWFLHDMKSLPLVPLGITLSSVIHSFLHASSYFPGWFPSTIIRGMPTTRVLPHRELSTIIIMCIMSIISILLPLLWKQTAVSSSSSAPAALGIISVHNVLLKSPRLHPRLTHSQDGLPRYVDSPPSLPPTSSHSFTRSSLLSLCSGGRGILF